MAGMAGLEPADAGVKVPCLTTWRHPNVFSAVDTLKGPGKTVEGLGSSPNPSPFCLGWVKGLEPSTPGTTIRCSNQLSYTHQIHGIFQTRGKFGTPEGIRTPGLLLRRQLLYPTELLAHNKSDGAGDGNRTHVFSLEG